MIIIIFNEYVMFYLKMDLNENSPPEAFEESKNGEVYIFGFCGLHGHSK